MRAHSRFLIRKIQAYFGKDSLIRGVEVGVWRGENSAALLNAFPNLRLTMVDQYQEYEDRFLGDYGAVMHKAMLQAKTETDFAANRREFLLLSSKDASALYADCIFDFIFIDADHSYEAVRKDIGWWLPKVRIGGLMMGHDYGGRQHGVKQAVDEQFTDVQVGRGKVWWVEK